MGNAMDKASVDPTLGINIPKDRKTDALPTPRIAKSPNPLREYF